MKRTLLSAALLASILAFYSCKDKTHVCDCKVNGQSSKVQLTYSSKKQAKKDCEDAETEFKKTDAAASCELSDE